MRATSATVVYKGERPGPGWHAHGVTVKRLWILDDRAQLRWICLNKQRWKHCDTGRTVHDRPAWDRAHAPYGLDVVFAVLAIWVLGGHKLDWSWDDDRPDRRTAQRWKPMLAKDAGAWLHAVRLVGIELAAPRPLEKLFPKGGMPPPGTNARATKDANLAILLRSALWTTTALSRALSIPIRTLLVEARQRWNAATPITS